VVDPVHAHVDRESKRQQQLVRKHQQGLCDVEGVAGEGAGGLGPRGGVAVQVVRAIEGVG